MKHIDTEGAIALLQKAIDVEGSQTLFAKRHGLSQAYVNSVMRRITAPSKKILDAVGLERVVMYRRVRDEKARA